MKKFLLVHFLTVFCFAAFSQTSDKGFSFQGYAIDPDGKALAGENVTVKFSLTPGTFTEEHNLTTDGFGVFHAIIGNSSTAKKAEFEKLDFTKKDVDYSLKVEVKKTSGGTYTTISNEPLLSVPYARKAANGVPVGTIVAYGGDQNNVPGGWLVCDGSSVAKSDYPQLYAVIGDAWGTSGSSFNLPDLRGRFLRGVDGGAARDEDRASRTASNSGGNTGDKVGTVQAEEFKSHNHSADQSSHTHGYNDIFHSENGGTIDIYNDGMGNSTGSGDSDNDNNGYGMSRTTGSADPTITVDNTGGNETRPDNAAVYFIIKY